MNKCITVQFEVLKDTSIAEAYATLDDLVGLNVKYFKYDANDICDEDDE